MRLDKFDLNLLVALDTILEERNVTRASERLHIGQSAASGALARLRDYFGDELLVPVAGRLVLTPLARDLVGPVRDALLRVRAAISLKPVFDPATADRRFVVCASDYLTTVLFADVVSRVAEQAPGVLIDIRSPMHDVFEVFDRGTIDLLFMPQPYLGGSASPKKTLFEDTHVCMVCRDNELVGDAMNFEQYMAMGHVAVHFGDERSVAFEDGFLPRFGQQRRIESIVDSFSMTPLVVMKTQRVVTLHRRQAEHFARQLPVRLVATPFEMPPLVEMMAWPAHLEGDPAHAWLRRMIDACISGLGLADAQTSATKPDALTIAAQRS